MADITVYKEETETSLESGLNTGYEITWESLSYRVKIKDQEKLILNKLSGSLKPGSVMAVIGASGAGKSSFLDCLSGRNSSEGVSGKILINGNENISLKHVSRYCSQEDALFGNLTVYETLMFAAQFNLPQSTPRNQLEEIVNDLITEFGLVDVKNTIIGTPLLKGCSGGQVRRVSVASQLVGMKSGILFLDEPTSGLDSVAAASVIESVKRLADRYRSTIIATIHQPATTTFNLFTHVLILAKGSTVYFGERAAAIEYFERIGRPIPLHFNPSDVYLQMTNTDFLEDREKGAQDVQKLIQDFESSPEQAAITEGIQKTIALKTELGNIGYSNGFIHQTKVLMNRAFLNAAKNPLSYWVRVAMYAGLAFLMGTTWLRMGLEQSRVSDRMVSLYFSVAFLAFMAVAGIPAFLEERHVFIRERANGLYGVESYILSNFIVSLPFLGLIAFTFSIIGYFLMGYQQSASNFFVFVAYMFVMLLVAEAQVQFISVVLPIFVAALTISAFTNGLWMVVNGFALIKISDIPPGWRFTFHYIDFQKYAFEALLKNELEGLTFNCATSPTSSNGCACMVPSDLAGQCQFTGSDVLTYYEHSNVSYGIWLLALLVLLLAFKLATYATLKIRGSKA